MGYWSWKRRKFNWDRGFCGHLGCSDQTANNRSGGANILVNGNWILLLKKVISTQYTSCYMFWIFGAFKCVSWGLKFVLIFFYNSLLFHMGYTLVYCIFLSSRKWTCKIWYGATTIVIKVWFFSVILQPPYSFYKKQWTRELSKDFHNEFDFLFASFSFSNKYYEFLAKFSGWCFNSCLERKNVLPGYVIVLLWTRLHKSYTWILWIVLDSLNCIKSSRHVN